VLTELPFAVGCACQPQQGECFRFQFILRCTLEPEAAKQITANHAVTAFRASIRVCGPKGKSS
jgi:hypothetical protein